ncbi:phage terminase large subunit [Gracilibacillus saliphilus]|uniref:phage terminase large subunit n=1 Tax=Gracilibacillus saliphilus TaxID=543890 RepID=UPI0013D63B01|nr:phage terminase large subunit [Gracilibacillus saliphilus]
MTGNEFDLMLEYLQKHFNDDEIEEILQTYEPTGENGIRKMLAEIDITYFGLTYLSDHFDKNFCRFHIDLIRNVKELTLEYSASNPEEIRRLRSAKEGQKLLTIAPRGHGKSRIINLLLNTWNLVYKKSPFIVCISANDALAQTFLELVKDALDNEKIKEDFGNLKGKTWNASQIILNNNTTLVAKGIKSKLRGLAFESWRPTTVIMDDIEDDRQSKSELSTEEIKGIFRSTIMSMGDTYTDYIFLGTIIGEDTLINELYKYGTGWKKLFYKSVYSFSDSPLWKEWEDIYNDLSNPNSVEDAREFFEKNKKEMLKGTEVLWEEKNDYYFLMRKKIDDGNSSFYSEQQNDPRSSSDYAFQNITYWDSLPETNEMDLFMFIDPSMGKSKDFSAITILGQHKKTNYKYVVDGQLHKVKPNQLIDIIIDLCKEYPIHTLGFESTLFQEYIADDLIKQLKEEELYHVLPKKVKPRTNKHNRIMNLEPFVTRSEILFNPSCVQYNNQVTDYNINAKNDDAIDSLQAAFELVHKKKHKRRVANKPIGL